MPLPSFPASVLRQAPAQVLHCSASLFRIFMTSRLGGNCFGIRLGGLFGGLCGRLVPSQLYRSRPVPQDICMIAPSHNSPPHLASQTYFPHLLHWRAPRQTLARRSPHRSRLSGSSPPRQPPHGAAGSGSIIHGTKNSHYVRALVRTLRATRSAHPSGAPQTCGHPRSHPSGDSHRAHPSGAPQTCGHPRSHPSGDSQERPSGDSHPSGARIITRLAASVALSAFGRLRTSSTSAISSDCESSGRSPLLLMIRQSRLCVSSPLTPLTPT